IDISGSFSPENKEVDITALADRLPIDILNPLLSTFASGIKGYASGKITMSGQMSQPLIGGSLFVDQGSMRVDYLQTDYKFSDSIRFIASSILLNNIVAVDDRGNSIIIDGEIRHKFFKEFGVDLSINATQAMVLNTKPKDNDMFYGTAFATGVIGIKSSESGIAFDISARTDRNTRFFVPLSSSESVGDYSFITFTSSDQQLSDSVRNLLVEQIQPEGNMSMNIDLEVTPDAEVQLVLDSKAGDVMRGRGNGRLNISMTPKGGFSISGDYIISSGDYLFTLGNILNKRFSVTEGSRISWNGDIAEADIDIRAVYKLEASLYELLQIEELRNRIPVECHLHMT
ncbi:MAG: translocation/assembly module TamB, partial [Actinobacteria bacterium]|nr:translocation/assembly module TamB [Actinomycetota bacterium]